MKTLFQTGSTVCIVLLCSERYLIVSYPEYHRRYIKKLKYRCVKIGHFRMNMKLLVVLISIFSSITSLFVVFEFEIICHGHESAHENLLGVCPEGKKAFLVYSKLRWKIQNSWFLYYTSYTSDHIWATDCLQLLACWLLTRFFLLYSLYSSTIRTTGKILFSSCFNE